MAPFLLAVFDWLRNALAACSEDTRASLWDVSSSALHLTAQTTKPTSFSDCSVDSTAAKRPKREDVNSWLSSVDLSDNGAWMVRVFLCKLESWGGGLMGSWQARMPRRPFLFFSRVWKAQTQDTQHTHAHAFTHPHTLTATHSYKHCLYDRHVVVQTACTFGMCLIWLEARQENLFHRRSRGKKHWPRECASSIARFASARNNLGAENVC